MENKEAIEALKLINLSRVHPFYSWEEMKDVRDVAISALEKQIPAKPYMDNENGVYEKEHCPTCHRSLFPNDHHCRCGQALDWSDTE